MDILNKDFKTTFNKKFRLVYLLAFIVFALYIFFSSRHARNITLRYKINGIVEKVNYDEKSIPEVTVKGKVYYLGSTLWNFNRLISVGDSIRKDSGDRTLKLIKRGTGRQLIFDGTKFYEK